MSPALTEVLAELLDASRAHERGVHRKLDGGLHVQVQTKGERQRLMCWREGGKLPSRADCSTLARDAGFLLPRYRQWEPEGSTHTSFVISDAAQGVPLCEHAWGMQVHGDGQKEFFYSSTCTKCDARWMKVMARRGKRVDRLYNGEEVTEAAWPKLVKRGPHPRPDAPSTLEEQALAKMRAVMTRPAPVPPAPLTEKERQDAEEAERRRVLQAAKDREVRHLMFLSRLRGLRDPWFRRPFVLDAYETGLRALSLPELRAERRSRFGQVQLALALPAALLICRWRLAHLALPEQASPVAVTRPKRPARKARALKATAPDPATCSHQWYETGVFDECHAYGTMLKCALCQAEREERVTRQPEDLGDWYDPECAGCRALAITVTQGGVGCPCQEETPDGLPDLHCPACNGAGLQFGDPTLDQPGLFGGAS